MVEWHGLKDFGTEKAQILLAHRDIQKEGIMSIKPPTSAEICRVTGASIATRNVMRISELSLVEQVTLTGRIPGCRSQIATAWLL